MSKAVKIWLIVAASLVLLGAVIFCGVMVVLNWDFGKLGTSKMATNSYDISESFENIKVDTTEAEIVFLKSADENCKVICYERENMTHTVEVVDGTLNVKVNDTRKWYQYIGVFSSHPMLTVYLPEGEYCSVAVKGSTGAVSIPKEFEFADMDISLSTGGVKNHASVSNSAKIKTTTGHITIEGASVGSLELSVSTGAVELSSVECEENIEIKVSTGKTRLTDVSCKSLISDGSTGDVILKNVIASDKFSIERSTGDVKFDACDAGEISVKTDTGDVKGSLLTEKVFVAKSDTGKVEHPKTASGGMCEITTDTGNINITLS